MYYRAGYVSPLLRKKIKLLQMACPKATFKVFAADLDALWSNLPARETKPIILSRNLKK